VSGPILSCRGLEKSFGTTPALRGSDLSVAPGELVSITGPRGSGKSTLLHCLSGIQKPDSGEVSFNGARVDDLDATARTLLRRREFGFVFQFGELVPELTAVENVALPLLLEGESRAGSFDRSRGWLDRVGVPELADRVPGELSGGQRQRIAVARALVNDPAVLFADEPTGALDSLAAELVLDLLVGLAESSELTLLMVTHDSRVAAYGHREIVVRDGRATTPSTLG
jgi:putative ABC transport system ATP-binding protein